MLIMAASLLTACDKGDTEKTTDPGSSDKSKTSDSSDKPEISDSDPDPKSDANVVIYDKNEIVITYKGQDNSKSLGPALKFLIENNSKEPIMIQDFNSRVNGFSADPIFNIDVDAGQKLDSLMEFMSFILEKDGIDILENVEFKLKIFSTETWMEIDQTDAITIMP